MGVFRLFRTFLNKYPRFFKAISKEDRTHYCDTFLIDGNATFYPVCREVYLGEVGGKKRLLSEKLPPPSQLEPVAFRRICEHLVHLTRIANPKRILYIAIDGVAGLSKQSQQRKRRFQNITEHTEDEFDFKNITAGTKWMERLCTYMYNYIEELRKTDVYFSRLEIIFSDVNVPGEGEHKMIRWMDLDNKSKSYTIYSPDADLILLCMGLNKKHLYVLRENQYDDIKADYLIVLIDKLKHFILEDIKWVAVEYDYNEDRMVKDYIFFLMLIGNDFLPSVPSVDTRAIDKIQHAYVTTAVNVGYLISEKNTINLPALTGFMHALAKIEPELLAAKLNTRVVQPDSVLVNNTKRLEAAIRVDMDGYRKDYYHRNFEGVSINKVCEEYVRGMYFIIQYYLNTIPTFDWYYPYHYAPLFTDLSTYLDEHPNLKISFNYRGPLSLVESLASILHPKSFYLLPKKVEEFLTLRKEIDPDFSEVFIVDLEGKMNDYEGVPLISTVDYDKIKMLLRPFRVGNTPGQPVVWKGKYVDKPKFGVLKPVTDKAFVQRKPVYKKEQISSSPKEPKEPKEPEDEGITVIF